MTHYQYWLGKVLLLICELLWVDKGRIAMKVVIDLEAELEKIERKEA